MNDLNKKTVEHLEDVLELKSSHDRLIDAWREFRSQLTSSAAQTLFCQGDYTAALAVELYEARNVSVWTKSGDGLESFKNGDKIVATLHDVFCVDDAMSDKS